MSLAAHRPRLLAGAALLLAPVAAHAQTPPPAAQTETPAADAQPDQAAAASPAEAQGNEVVVTGSRIARPEFAAPNPIVSFNAAALQQSGNTNVTTFLQRVPALTGSRDVTQTSGGNGVSSGQFGVAGLNELNLRNLGTNRTLVLVNGRRHVAGEANSAAVDINSIPTDLIERTDVLTGAVSAVYGADGVTGVVNFILKRDFEGVGARAQFGVSQYGDAANRFASVIAGHNFADGRANVTLAYEYNFDAPVANDQRKFLRQGNRKFLIPNDADANDDPNVPDNILVGDLRYPNESPLGAVFVGGEGTPSFDGLGRPYDNGTPAAYYATGGVNTPVAGFYQGDLFPKTERHDVNLLTHYDFSDAFKLSLEGKFVQTRASSNGAYFGTYFQPIAVDNPFVPTAISSAARGAGADTLYVNRDNIDYGRQGESNRRRTYRGVADVSGRISDHATYDAYYEYGRTDVQITRIGDRLADRYTQALDAVRAPGGQVVCRITLTDPNSGCVPISLFGAGPATAQQLAYFQVNDRSGARITQQVASASLSGDFGQFFELPGGPIQFAFGGEYRRETSRFRPSDNLINARFFQYDEPSLVLPSSGKFDVKEAFGELNVPLFKDVAFAQTLSFGAAGRYSDYSTVGHTKTWQFNGVYAPVRDVTFRGSYGQSVRAPNIGELFQPRFTSSNFFTDPCTPAQIGNGTQYRVANCTAALAAVGATSSTALQTVNFVTGVQSGNADLRAERARTWTAGIVVRPSFLRGFTASADWYDIRLKDAINQVTPSDLANLCVDQPTTANPFCAAITRADAGYLAANPALAGLGFKVGSIVNFRVSPQNVASFRTSGLDINLDYLLRTASVGTFDFRLVGGYLNRLDFTGIIGAPVTDNLDQSGTNKGPRWNANFSPSWTLGGFNLNYNLRWFDATLAFDRNTLAANPDVAAGRYIRNDALWQHDLQAQYQLPDGFAFYGGVTNLTDQKPDPASFGTNNPISPLGRFFYVGVKIRPEPR
ncbi:TonB-dependent receptor plug domain-containing protein [Sphingomonas sp.]|uniref:TonB-dependent receptor plug domain-containing protein n=1 Tax=Sphingomonas sp. TaxID=28214 RepID=UPI0035BBE4E8